MSELDLNEHGDMTMNTLLERAKLDVVRNGHTKTVAVKELLHGLHSDTPVSKLVEKTTAPSKTHVLNHAMSSEKFREHENVRMQKIAQFERKQHEYLHQGGAPHVQDYW